MILAKTFEIIFWSLCVFGFFCLLKMVCSHLLLKNTKFLKADIILTVNNDAETVENTIRMLAEEILFTSRGKLFNNVTVINNESSDDTMKIVHNLKREYPFLKTK